MESPTETTLFSGDPIHHMVPNHSVASPSNIDIPCILPDKEAVKALADVFFTNVCTSKEKGRGGIPACG